MINPKYSPLWACGPEIRYFILTGGRGSAKSFAVGTFLTQLMWEVGHRVLFTRYTMKSAEISIIPEFTDKIDRLEWLDAFHITKDEVTNTVTGSGILFSGIKASSGDQTARLKSLAGVTTWVLDEAEELTDEDTFDTIDLSIRQANKHNRVILVMNPATKEHWIYKRFFEQAGVEPGSNEIKGNVCYIHTTYLDNIHHLAQSFLDGIETMRMNNPEKYRHKILGGWLDKAEGVIFNNWAFGEFPKDLPYIFGQDYGFSVDPDVMVKIAIDDKLKTVYWHECFYANGQSPEQLISSIRQHAKPTDLIVADNAEPRLNAQLRHAGLNVQEAEKGPDSVRNGIRLLSEYRHVITPTSSNLAKEFNNYAWNDKKSDTPIDAWNHGIDAGRYAFMRLKGNPNYGQYAVY